MAKKIKFTRPQLKRYRQELARYERYLPMLKLKQQQLQVSLRDLRGRCDQVAQDMRDRDSAISKYAAVWADLGGANVPQWAEPDRIETSSAVIAGIVVPAFEKAIFPSPSYGLFSTGPWVDKSLEDLRELQTLKAQLAVLEEQMRLLERELRVIMQRVNLFEKIKIPEAQDAIRMICIKLGDEMTAAVGRAKIAKSKLSARAAA